MKMNLKSMVTMSVSLLVTVSSCVHAGTVDSNQSEIYEYANSVVDSIDLQQTNDTVNLIITELNGTTIGFDTNVINILEVDYSFLRQEVNQKTQKKIKKNITSLQDIIIQARGYTACGKSFGHPQPSLSGCNT